MPYKIYNFPSLASTQDKAKEFVKKGLSNIVISADRQAKGHGRFKRKWHSAKGGLYASIILNPENTENIQYLTFAAAIAVVKSIKKIANLDAAIKWPNDVHYNKRKLCGILTEGIFGAKNHVIVGIGPLSQGACDAAQTCGFNPRSIFRCSSLEQARTIISAIAKKNDTILLKGSRAMKLEDLLI